MPTGIIQRRVLLIGCIICFSFFAQQSFGQQLQTITDKNNILIGEQLKIKFKASFPAGTSKVNWFNLPDSIPHFDIVDKGKLDSSNDNGNAVLEQTIAVTSFDSGKWTFPAFPVNLDPVKDDTTYNLFTDSLAITVAYSPADTSAQLRDIKPIIGVTIKDYTLYYIIGGAVLLLVLLFLVYRYWKKNRKEKPQIPVSKLSPYDEAIQELKKLAGLDLQDPAALKLYHSKLADIFKHYLGRKLQRNLMTKTTSDILVRMNEGGMAAGHVSELATALRCTDAVKFAKYQPSPNESDDCMQKVKAIIGLVEKHQISNLPAEALAKAGIKPQT